MKIYIKTAPTCFGAITIIRERIFELSEARVIKIILTTVTLTSSNMRSLVMVIAQKHVGAVLM
jgi:hypothetical protein